MNLCQILMDFIFWLPKLISCVAYSTSFIINNLTATKDITNFVLSSRPEIYLNLIY